MVSYFFNDNENITVMFAWDFESLSKRHLITSMCINGIHYGFYQNCPELERNRGFLFTGKRIEIPEKYAGEYNIVKRYQSTPSTQIKLTKFFFSNEILIKKIQDHFKNYTDLQFKVNCIFHDDKNPSLNINVERGVYYCFSCTSSGTLAKLVSRLKL